MQSLQGSPRSGEPDDAGASRADDRRVLFRRVAFSLGMAVLGAILVVMSFGSAEGTGRATQATGCVFMAGFASLVIAALMLLAALWWFVRVPKFNTPKEVAEVFYKELLGGESGSAGRAWMCLDSAARAEIGTLEEFRKYWTDAAKRVERWGRDEAGPRIAQRPKSGAGKIESSALSENIRVENAGDTRATLRADVRVWVWQSATIGKDAVGNVQSGIITYAKYLLPQEKTLIRGPKRWYLTSGRLDEPPSRTS